MARKARARAGDTRERARAKARAIAIPHGMVMGPGVRVLKVGPSPGGAALTGTEHMMSEHQEMRAMIIVKKIMTMLTACAKPTAVHNE